MNWFHRSFLGLSIALVGGAVHAEEPRAPSAATTIGLGRPLPLPADSAPVRALTAFEPIRLPPAAQGQLPRPTVVRGARSSGEGEQSSQFLPKEVPALKFPTPPLPQSVTQPMPIQEGMTYFRVDKNVTIKVLPEVPDAGSLVPVHYRDERIIIIDENGNQIFGDRTRATWYGRADWLLWWTKGFGIPPLVTTASPTDPERTRGALGAGNTQLIFGNDTTTAGPRSGGRFTVGRYLDPCGCDALEATFFFLGQKQDAFIASSADLAVLARPFFNVNINQQDRELVATPATLPSDFFLAAGPGLTGAIQVDSSSRLWGMEANLRRELETNTEFRLSGLFGFRYVDLSEQLNITERFTLQQTLNPVNNALGFRVGDQFGVFDSFHTRNRFYGGQLGVAAEWQRSRWTLDARLKIALGANTQTVDIEGNQTVLSLDGKRRAFTGGLYALQSNSGRQSQIRFSAVPEIGFKLGCNLTDNLRVYAGYDFLYWGNVLRPGDQIDQQLDANKIPTSGAADPPANVVRPVVPFRSTNFWAQGVSAGLELRY